MDIETASRLVFGAYAALFILHIVLPARLVQGYCCDSSGKPLSYRLNGIVVYVVALYLFYQEDWFLPEVARNSLYDNHQACAACACVFGLIVSTWFYMRGCKNATEESYSARNRCITVDMVGAIAISQSALARSSNTSNKNSNSNYRSASASNSAKKGRSPPAAKLPKIADSDAARGRSRSRSRARAPPPAAAATDGAGGGSGSGSGTAQNAAAKFFLGSEFNPRVLGVDVKMFLYLAGAVMLQLNLLSAVTVHMASRQGRVSLALKTYIGCFSWFLIEYLLGEQVRRGACGVVQCVYMLVGMKTPYVSPQ